MTGDNTYDVIVIGSGISGMTAAIIAAKQGEKTLVLEQHSIPGGLTQTYTRSGNTFPTGVHRLGSLNPGEPLWYYFRYLGFLDHLHLEKLDENCFERIYFPGRAFDIPVGHQRYREQLMAYFPDEKKAIDQYLADMKRVVSTVGYYNPGLDPEKDMTLAYTQPMAVYFKTIGASKKLTSLLYANNPLYGISSRECPMLTHFIISDCYLNSSFRVNETQTPLAKIVVDRFKALGGEVIPRSRVDRVMTEGAVATGVLLDSGTPIFAKKVIFSGHPGLLLDICPPELFRPVYRKRLTGTQDAFGIFGVALNFPASTCPVKSNDAFVYDTWDVNASYERKTLFEGGRAETVFLSALPAAGGKDYAVSALTGVSRQDIRILEGLYGLSEKTQYQQAKTVLRQKIMDNLRTVFDDRLDSAEIVDTYSPMTFSRYTLTKNGSAYGIRKTAQNFLQGFFKPATRIQNLFLTGQSMAFSGVHGAIVSSVMLGALLYGKTYLMDQIINYREMTA